jgi:hypothetical protein
MLSPGAHDLQIGSFVTELALNGYARLGRVLSDEGLEQLRTRADDLMLGRLVYPGMFFQPDATTGRYEDAPLGLGWQGPSLDYRKLEKLELDLLFLAWLSNPLFERLAHACIGEAVTLYRAIIFNKGPAGGSDIPWHQDGGKLWGIDKDPLLQIWTALDDAPVGGGCLEVVPGSQRHGLATPLGGVVPKDLAERTHAEQKAVAIPVMAGEAVLVHPMVWHRSGRGQAGQRRRAFSACYLDGATKCVRKKGTPRTFLRVFGENLS